MKGRHRRRDGSPFWGCSRYPKCKGTRPLTHDPEDAFYEDFRRRPAPAVEDDRVRLLEGDLRALVIRWHPDRGDSLDAHEVVSELTRLWDIARGR
jgi:ssDNA-binding Zn-finger/Zn-ribbon topoisomerase 1